MNFLSRKSVLSFLLAFSMLSIIGINHYQLSYATLGLCSFDTPPCPPGTPNANSHLDEAKKSIDNGNYTGAKNHIDLAKQMISNSSK